MGKYGKETILQAPFHLARTVPADVWHIGGSTQCGGLGVATDFIGSMMCFILDPSRCKITLMLLAAAKRGGLNGASGLINKF